MAVDTREKRLSIISLGKTFQPVILTPENGIDQVDRQTLLWGYSGIEWEGSSTDVLTSQEFFSGTPEITTGTFQQLHDLLSVNLATQTPTITTSSIETLHKLIVQSFTSGIPIILSPSIEQIHVIIGSVLVTGIPVVKKATVDYSPTGGGVAVQMAKYFILRKWLK